MMSDVKEFQEQYKPSVLTPGLAAALAAFALLLLRCSPPERSSLTIVELPFLMW